MLQQYDKIKLNSDDEWEWEILDVTYDPARLGYNLNIKLHLDAGEVFVKSDDCDDEAYNLFIPEADINTIEVIK